MKLKKRKKTVFGLTLWLIGVSLLFSYCVLTIEELRMVKGHRLKEVPVEGYRYLLFQ